MGCKSVETTRNISNIFGPGIANKHTVQWWFKKFSQGNESLVDEEFSGHQSEIDNDQLRVLLKLILLQLQAAAAAKSLQSCLTLCDPMDGSPPGSPVPGILQARTLERVAISFFNTTTGELTKELNVDHSVIFWYLKQIGQVKKLDKWMPHEMTKNQNNHFEVLSSLVLPNNNELFLHWIVMCDKKWILYDNWR